ncbi:DNA replication/repair protein RecF [Nannocystaceae bacterium ST9]
MQLERLSLADFRNFASATPPITLEFGERFTILHGHNGAGKTNILEAIYLVSTLRSFRTTELGALLRRGCEHARVEIQAFDTSVDLTGKLEVRLDRSARAIRRTARIDGKLVRSAAEFYGRIQAILFTPEDLAVLRGSPSARRQFVDRVVFARERGHIGDVQTYEKLLRSRNRVLKTDFAPIEVERMLDAYDHQLAEVGARIWTRRTTLIAELHQPFAQAFAQIHDREQDPALLSAELRYASRLDPSASVPVAERRAALVEALLGQRKRDLLAGRTTVGPHLDDLQVTLDGTRAGEFASQGQTRALVLAFKIAELRAARERSGRAPLLLLDDVSSELDPLRTARLFEVLAAEVGQCVLTTTTPGYLELGAASRRELEVRDGQLTPT